jgi:hypothetical protein
MNTLDLKTIGKVATQFLVILVATFLVQWGGGVEWLEALKASCGMAATWLLGNLQPTGGVVPSIEGLKKSASEPQPQIGLPTK